MLSDDIHLKYEFNEAKDQINSGSYGQIYIIRDKKVKTEYVLKKIIKSKTDDESFKNEIEFLKETKGTNIINIIDYYLMKMKNFIILY